VDKHKVLGSVLGLFVFTEANEYTYKHSLKCNMVHIYEETAPEVNNITDMFTQGVYYGRLRFNSFGFKWADEMTSSTGKVLRKDHAIAAIGGSLLYKSAYLHGFAIGGGLYTSQSVGSLSESETYLYKAGKDVLSRYDVLTDGRTNLSVLAEAYIEYKYKGTSFKYGRQIFESFLTKSNDTKMIPNTFEGVTLNSYSIHDTSVKMAYFTQQKLRDHSEFHHVLAVGDDSTDAFSKYTENDDSAMHIGLKASELEALGIEDRLIVVEAKNRSIDNLTLNANYTAVPELLSSAMIQADYRIELGEWSMIPGVRYMQQFDDGAGAIGGANHLTLSSSYTNPESLESALFAARVDVVKDAFKLRFAYSEVEDKGDIIAPWRGFPTGGFTRAMGQYNWYANTRSYMMQLDYVFENFSDMKIISRFAVQDFDDEKIGVQADSNVFTLDIAKKFMDNTLYVKTRYAHVMGDDNTIASNGLKKLDPSYDELRFEINYLF